MGMPSPFQIGAGVGNAISGAFEQKREYDAIDQILENASNENDPDAMQEALTGILKHVSPERQPQAIQILQQKHNNIQQGKELKEQARLANVIEEGNPNSSMHKLIAHIYRSSLPTEQKEKMIKNISGTFPFRAEQQERLNKDSVLKRYNARIKELDAEISKTRIGNRQPLEEQRKKLVRERDLLLDFDALRDNEEEFKAIKEGQGKELDEETAQKFLDLADGDFDRAEQMARDKGYKF